MCTKISLNKDVFYRRLSCFVFVFFLGLLVGIQAHASGEYFMRLPKFHEILGVREGAREVVVLTSDKILSRWPNGLASRRKCAIRTCEGWANGFASRLTISRISQISWMGARLPFRNTYHKGFALFMGQTRYYHAPDENNCLITTRDHIPTFHLRALSPPPHFPIWFIFVPLPPYLPL